MNLGPYELGYNDTNQGIYVGDCKLLCEEIPDESIDLIFTDPVYQNMDDYAWLARTAARVLRDGGALLTFYGIGWAPETHSALSGHGMSYRWRFVIRTVWSNEFHGRLIVGTQEILWYEKNHSTPLTSIFDLQMASMSGRGQFSKNHKNWGKHIGVCSRIVTSFCPVDGVALDPFTGSGTVPAACKMLSRYYLALEIIPQTATIAQQRLTSTPIPLPLITPTQPNLL